MDRLIQMKRKVLMASCLTIFSTAMILQATNYYVSPTGSNPASGGGTFSQPFLTIQKAADVMQPGDTCYVRGGTYRERITPPRGGTSENARIVYKAYPGETPVVKGSERITTWTLVNGNVYKADIPDATFGSFNPYTTTLSGEWMYYGTSQHAGNVYLNGKPYFEKFVQSDLTNAPATWFASHAGTTTSIYANFAGSNPNTDTAEVTARELVFFPATQGLKYITVDGFTMRQAACGWGPPESFQKGLIGTYYGYKWIIQNNTVTDAKCIGICSGNISNNNFGAMDLTAMGSHIVRYNYIARCGQSGIGGARGFCKSLIEGNLIEDINYEQCFGGEEQAGIKVHYTVDLTVKDNIVRRVYGPKSGQAGSAIGIWMDWANQGTRLTGNIVYDCEYMCMVLEMNHGPQLVDNNIIMENLVDMHSENSILVNNLFYRSAFYYRDHSDTRASQYWTPHTGTQAGTAACYDAGYRIYNNISIYQLDQPFGLNYAPISPTNCVWDYNVFYQNTSPNPEGTHTLTDVAFQPNFGFQTLTNGVKIGFDMNSKPTDIQCPSITNSFVGVVSPANQGVEDANGNPISVTQDILGSTRGTHPLAGPFEQIQTTNNEHIFLAGPNHTTPGNAVTYDSHWNMALGANPSVSSGSGGLHLNDISGVTDPVRFQVESSTMPLYCTFSWRYPQTFTKVALETQYCQTYGPKNFDVQVSDDGTTNWTTVASSGDITYTSNGWGQTVTPTLTFAQQVNKKGLRAKINSASSGTAIIIDEIRVYNTGAQLNTGAMNFTSQTLKGNVKVVPDRVDMYDSKGRLVKSNIPLSTGALHNYNSTIKSPRGIYLIVYKLGNRIVESRKMVVAE